jgi:hypothetical protein
MRCNRYLVKQKYIEYLQRRVNNKKKKMKTPSEALVRYDSVLARKRSRVTRFIERFKCLTVRKNPFCSKVQLLSPCKNAPDTHGTTMRTIKAQITRLNAIKSNLCKPKKVPKKKAVPAPNVTPVTPSTPSKIIPVVGNCSELNKLKAEINTLYTRRLVVTTQLAVLTKKMNAVGSKDTKESLEKDKVSREAIELREKVFVFLRKARNAQIDFDNNKK